MESVAVWQDTRLASVAVCVARYEIIQGVSVTRYKEDSVCEIFKDSWKAFLRTLIKQDTKGGVDYSEFITDHYSGCHL